MQDGAYSLLKNTMVYEREDAQGTRYWAVESGLTDGVPYEYLISFKDASGKETVKGPVSTTLHCTESDRQMLAAKRDQMKKTTDLLMYGRCGRATLTWLAEEKISKENIRVHRRTQNETYSLRTTGMIYEKAQEGGIRYWISDSGLTDGLSYEYSISFKDAQGKEIVRGPASITLTCNEKDKETVSQQEKALKEYYQKRGIEYTPGKSLNYTLGKERYNVELGNAPQKGRKDAPVTIAVFTDFECTHCSTWAQTLHIMLKTFPQDIKIVFKNYTIPYHTHSVLAAMAALAAGAQGKFWEMHDLLFNNQGRLGKEDILGYAKLLELDLSQFEKSLESAEIKKIIAQDNAQGNRLGVQVIPTTFINGRSLVGSPPAPYMKGLIEDILKNKIK
jgi:protein-disulfide isomerase